MAWNQILVGVVWCVYRQTSAISRAETHNLNVSSRLAVVFVKPIEARCHVDNEHVVGAAPTAPTCSNYIWDIWVIYNSVAYWGAAYITGFMVAHVDHGLPLTNMDFK